ncbi:hypothetical protein [Streptomyces sp. NPDC014676]|uniref:hypothetical protein n=1 Tax=Streptomyces sp. NPDC014676 TaxID=3364879 RepID=UPI003702AA87
MRIFFAERLGIALQDEATLDRVDDAVRQLLQAAVRRDRQTWSPFSVNPGRTSVGPYSTAKCDRRTESTPAAP